MIKKVLRAIKQYNMINGGDKICVALSGGADSVALLHVLSALRGELQIEVTAAHLNHCLRGAESDRDERFVRELCEKLGVTLYVGSADVNALSAKSGESCELAARKARYAFLESVAAAKVATAHTASDNTETFIINATRGTALKGLCGIPAVRGIFIRPLLYCTRSDIEKYCKDNSLPFVTDSTNLSDDYTRNRIRHSVVPVLKGVNGSLDLTVRRVCDNLAVDSDFLEKETDRLYCECKNGNTLTVKADTHKAIATRMIARLISDVCGKPADSLHILDIFGALGTKKRTELFAGFYVLTDGRKITVLRTGNSQKTRYNVKTEVLSRECFDKTLKINKLLLKNAIDCDKIADVLNIRTRLPEDTFRQKGRNVTKNLRKLYNECKIPTDVREVLPVAADGDGIVWVCGIGVAERVCVDKSTKNVLVFDYEIIKS